MAIKRKVQPSNLIIDKINNLWDKYGKIYAGIITVILLISLFFAFRVKIHEVKVVDESSVNKVYKELSSLHSEVSSTKVDLAKRISDSESTIKNVQMNEKVTKTYDPNTGKLISEIVDKSTDDKSTIKTATKTTEKSKTATDTETNSSDTEKTKTEEINKKTTKEEKTISPKGLLGITLGLTLQPLNGFMPDAIFVGPVLCLSDNFEAYITGSYSLIGNEFKDRLKVNLGLSFIP